MEALSPNARPSTRDRGFSDTFAARPRVFNERDPMRHGSSPVGRENRSPSNVPKGLETMLKTTTETGDIGMFSIKPSRVPNPSNTPRRIGTGLSEIDMQKTRQAFQPYGVPIVDDRRRLPSYARDNSSEALSMYETASQKSASRTFDDPDYRSYSMTQTYSSYTLSNHRSYTSLRSQPDGNGVIQRPRSPFAYPTRLKRPGFRPSSPALTDGGAVDYSRRVEIGRAPYGAGQSTSSPASLYAQKRRPPLSLRHEANRSTPSLLSQSSPPRRSSSPLVPRQNGLSGGDWQRRHVTASGNTSPARSTLSVASTVNLYATLPTSSATTTPGKLHPPSPLYYDYTEDFEVEVCAQPQVLDPPPQFRIEKTIPEDRPMSAEGPATGGSQHMFSNDTSRFQTIISSSSDRPDIEESQASKLDNSAQPEHVDAASFPDDEGHSQRTGEVNYDAEQRKKVIRLSGLGYGARELSCHVEEAFGLPSSSSFLVNSETRRSFDVLPISSEKDQPRRTSRESQCLPPSGRARARSSGFNSINTGLTELTELIQGTNKPHENKQDGIFAPPGRTPMTSPTIPEKSKLRDASAGDSGKPSAPSFAQQRGRELQMLAQRQPIKRNNQRARRVDPPQVAKDVPNFSHQIPQKAISRPESPMLAPKPISPARQLKLKNSIPRLMKALPPVPSEPAQSSPPPPGHSHSHTEESPSLFTSLVADLPRKSSIDTAQHEGIAHNLGKKLPSVHEEQVEIRAKPEIASNTDTKDDIEQNANKNSAPKLKLKGISNTALRSLSPLSSQPWNLENNDSWLNENLNARLQSSHLNDKPTISKQPKFRLRVIRASNSTQGTVRVTRDNENAEPSNGIHLQNPKDLFTPSPGIDNLFRNFGRHLHSRKTSANSNYHSEESEPMFAGTTTSSPANENRDEDGYSLRGPPMSVGGVFEARSVFSDDSSQAHGSHSLRKRISNLRARIAVPYTAKVGAQSYDDITWKDRHAPQIVPQPTNQSDSNLPANRRSSDIKPMRRFAEKLHRQRLKAKVRSWIQGARSVIARVRPRHSRSGSGSGSGSRGGRLQ
ncbi:uncharacterized protein LY89DRAFT_291737 [Mollisia scopiformis]|uniref:Uncharacterized protein n=1 Tax=Mollisia scopiformis TaxID=149040 RepID=A0A194XPT2_MOLSC|nr:uncharacterized protein LY89DRAFT_291737 [Mollisia scopiformis]KUJ22265.1 hypothetical protein LY89DRAFT_291737 [Mollisia scopiformis]